MPEVRPAFPGTLPRSRTPTIIANRLIIYRTAARGSIERAKSSIVDVARTFGV